MDRASSKLGPRYKEGLDVFQAQVVIKATLFLTAMCFILEAINYYYISINIFIDTAITAMHGSPLFTM